MPNNFRPISKQIVSYKHIKRIVFSIFCLSLIALSFNSLKANSLINNNHKLGSINSDNRFKAFSLTNSPADSTKKETLFDRVNKRAENLFRLLPVPMYGYSFESGHAFGLAKYNLVDIYEDTVTMPSRISGVIVLSTKGRVNFSISTELILKDNKVTLLSYVNFRKTPEYVLGIGNNVKLVDAEPISTDRFRFYGYTLFKVNQNSSIGAGIEISDYYNIIVDSNSILKRENAVGLNGGFLFLPGLAYSYDSRDNRYNAKKGAYCLLTGSISDKAIGSNYNFYKFNLDIRKYFSPWLNHTIAFQATSIYSANDVPFYELAMLGGDAQMRGYYKGALRDKVLVDCQLEYRMPIWKIFGIVAWAGTGKVAPSFDDFTFDKMWFSYGAGIRVRVDTKHNTNLRFDYGRGSYNFIHAFNIGFAEAF